MKRAAHTLVVVLGFLGVLLAAEHLGPKSSHYADGLYGFSIDAPQFPKAASGSTEVRLVLMAPAEQDFCANVNLMIQHVSTTREQYRESTLAQFGSLGFKVNSEQTVTVSGRDAIIFDYEGKANDREFRWLALAVIDAERVFLVTCTAPKGSFEKYEKAFRSCLNSFKMEQ